MQNRSKAINRLALVLLSIVVLELVLIGNQVQPVKAIKKKILIKKLKKILPLMALLKPKKKLILVPIPIPMFNKHHAYNAYPHQQNHQHHVGRPLVMGMMNEQGSMQMTPLDAVSLSGFDLGQAADMRPTPVTIPLRPTMTVESPASAAPDSMTMTMPSMTMIMTSNGNGQSAATVSAMELTNGGRLVPQVSGALRIHPPNSNHHKHKAQKQQQWPKELQQQHEDIEQLEHELAEPRQQQQQQNWDTGADYYHSPWPKSRLPLASPAKLLHTNNSRHSSHTTARPAGVRAVAASSESPPASRNQRPATAAGPMHQPARDAHGDPPTPREEPPRQQTAKQFAAAIPVVVVKSGWSPAGQGASAVAITTPAPSQHTTRASELERLQPPPQRLSEQQTQQIHQALEYERLEAIGPPHYMRFYQTSDGLYHMTPPPQPKAARTQTPTPANSGREQEDLNSRQAKGESCNDGNNEGQFDDSSPNSEVSTTAARQNDGLHGLSGNPQGGVDLSLNQEPAVTPPPSATTVATAPQATAMRFVEPKSGVRQQPQSWRQAKSS